MDLFVSYYGKQTFLLYSLFAKVPGTKAWPRQIFLTFSIAVLSFTTVYQVMKVVIEKFQREVIIDLLPTTAATCGTLIYIPYVAFATEKRYKELLSIIVSDLREKRTEEEDEIKEKYVRGARIFVKAYTTILLAVVCAVPLSGFVPYFLDLLIPLNETRERELIMKGGIFIDEKKYFYHLYVCQSCVAFVVGIVIGVSENMGVIIGQHLCGMIEILGYRLENLTRIEDPKLLGKSGTTHLFTRRLKVCVSRHQRIMQFIVLITAFYDVPLTLVLIGTFSALTVSLVQMTDPELINMAIVFFTVGQVLQLLLLSYIGQSGTDASREISTKAYCANWYVCPANLRRLLQMMILRSSKPCMVVASSMYTLTLANFMSVMQTVTSCYMVLRQTS